MQKCDTKIMLVCSDGGHLAQILELEEMFRKYNYLLVVEESQGTLMMKPNYNIKYLKGRSKGHRRNIFFFINILVNFYLSLKFIISFRPKIIITTGSHTAVPVCLLGKLLGVKVIWILSFARINSRAFSADIVYPFADKFIVQWPGVQMYYKNSVYLGGIY